MADEAAGEVANLHLDEVTGERVRFVRPIPSSSHVDGIAARVSLRKELSSESKKKRRKAKLLRHRRRLRNTSPPRKRRAT